MPALTPETRERVREALRRLMEQSQVAATYLAQHGVVWAQVAGEHTRRGCIAAAKATQGGCTAMAKTTCSGCRTVAARLDSVLLKDLLPALQHYVAQMQDELHGIPKWDMFRLRGLDDDGGIGDYVNVQLEVLIRELRRLPLPAVAALAFFAERGVSSLTSLSAVLVQELLRGHSAIAHAGLVASVAPGTVALYCYREALLQDVAAVGSGPSRATLVSTLLVRNCRRMPPVFWASCVPFSAVAVHVTKGASAFVLRHVVRMRLRYLTLYALLGVALGRGYRNGSVQLMLDQRSCPPLLRKVLQSTWYNLQVLTRASCHQLVRLYAALRQRKEPRLQAALLQWQEQNRSRSDQPNSAAAAVVPRFGGQDAAGCRPSDVPLFSPDWHPEQSDFKAHSDEDTDAVGPPVPA